MGWKLAIVVMPLNGRSPEAAISDFYGEVVSVEQTVLSVEEVLYPDDDKIAYACANNDQLWVFNWRLVMDVLENGYAGKEDAGFFLLQSTTNLYGFAVYKNCVEIRRRAGSSDDGFYADNGDLLEAEQKGIEEIREEVSLNDALAAWKDPEITAESADDELTHDVMGENIVFSLMMAETGIRFDITSDEGDAFFEKPVLKVSGRKKRFGLF